jgi:hypothetical protein
MDVLCGKRVTPVTSPEASRDSVRIVDAEKTSAKTGKKVKV